MEPLFVGTETCHATVALGILSHELLIFLCYYSTDDDYSLLVCMEDLQDCSRLFEIVVI
jgi:hypothetical protein